MPESGLTDFFGHHSKRGKLLFTISQLQTFFLCKSSAKITYFKFHNFTLTDFRKLEARNDSGVQRFLLLEKVTVKRITVKFVIALL